MGEAHKISLRERIRLNLLSAMDRSGINQVQLADKLGISKGTVNNWARGNNSPDVDMVPQICEVLGISILDLYSPTKFESQEPANKKSPNAAEAASGEDRISLEESNRLLVALGLIQDGQDLSDDDLSFLGNIVSLLDAWFSKRK